jgi:hypothetical protein
VLGIGLTALNAVWMTSMEILWNQGYATLLSLYYNVVFTLVVVLLVNGLFRSRFPAHALNRAELLLLFLMATMGTSIAMMTEYLMAVLAFPYHYGPLDTRWSAHLIPHLSKWFTVSDPQAVKNYYLGNANLWTWKSLRPWITPFLGWGLFIVALVATGICLSVLVYNQWRHQERMPFPLVQIPVMLTEPQAAFTRVPLFWLGFALAAGIDILNALNHAYPAIPGLQVKRTEFDMPGLSPPWSALSPIFYSFNPFLIGLEFFLPLDLLFSIVFFFWMGRMQGVLCRYMGVEIASSADTVAPYVREQAFGALMAILFYALWTMRKRWRESWEKYPTLWPVNRTLIGTLFGCAAMIVILICAGMPAILAALFIVIFLLVAVGFARIRAQYGPPSAGLLLGAPGPVLYSLLGRDTLGMQGLSSLALTHWMGREFSGHPLPVTVESFALSEQRIEARVLPVCLLAGALTGYVAAWGTALVTGYRLGQGTAHVSVTQFYFGNEAYALFSSHLSDRVGGLHLDSLTAMGLGAGLTLLLQALRTQFIGFPLHPVGYAIASCYTATFLWSTALITWLFKLFLLRYAGLKGYYRAAPFFLGLLLGEFLVGSLICLAGTLTGTDMYVFWPY